MNPTKRSLLKDLWLLQSKRRRLQFFLLLGLMILATFFEVVSLGAVIPFLGVLTDPEAIYSLDIIQPLILVANINDSSELIMPITGLFITSALCAALVRLFLLYISIRFSFAVGADLSVGIYRRTLYQDYATHVSRNSSEVINGIIRKTSTVSNGVVTPLLTCITAITLVIGISTALLFVNKEVAIISFFGFGSIYSLIILYSKKRLHDNGECIAKETTSVIQTLQEGLGGIRDVLIDRNQEFYCHLYRSSDLPLRKAAGDNQFVSNSPRFVMEAIGMSLIASLAYFMIKEGGALGVLPVLGALALGAQRLLPALQQAYAAYTTFLGAIPEFRDAIILLKQPLPLRNNKDLEPLPFKNEIELKNINFKHSVNLPYVLKDINLKFKKGSSTGFIGITGSGKTTLLDIIMMLLIPTTGDIYVDSNIINDGNRKKWQANISHVPQTVFLSDATIEENIAFGIPKDLIDMDRVISSGQKAEISDMIKDLKDGYKTMVGERGLMLSGGQRQRIGIARALYKQSSVLIFDEATSALDSQTEKKIMNTINSLDNNLTIFIIAHRITTLKDCDQIIDLSNIGKAIERKYHDIEH